MLFPTTLVGSYPQPDWLIDRPNLASRFPPRIRMQTLWRVPEHMWRVLKSMPIEAEERMRLSGQKAPWVARKKRAEKHGW